MQAQSQAKLSRQKGEAASVLSICPGLELLGSEGWDWGDLVQLEPDGQSRYNHDLYCLYYCVRYDDTVWQSKLTYIYSYVYMMVQQYLEQR